MMKGQPGQLTWVMSLSCVEYWKRASFNVSLEMTQEWISA